MTLTAIPQYPTIFYNMVEDCLYECLDLAIGGRQVAVCDDVPSAQLDMK